MSTEDKRASFSNNQPSTSTNMNNTDVADIAPPIDCYTSTSDVQSLERHKSEEIDAKDLEDYRERKRLKKKKRDKLKRMQETQEGKKKHKRHKCEEHRKHKHRKHRKHKHKHNHHSSTSEGSSQIRFVLFSVKLFSIFSPRKGG